MLGPRKSIVLYFHHELSVIKPRNFRKLGSVHDRPPTIISVMCHYRAFGLIGLELTLGLRLVLYGAMGAGTSGTDSKILCFELFWVLLQAWAWVGYLGALARTIRALGFIWASLKPVNSSVFWTRLSLSKAHGLGQDLCLGSKGYCTYTASFSSGQGLQARSGTVPVLSPSPGQSALCLGLL